jgi:hypothetical protein
LFRRDPTETVSSISSLEGPWSRRASYIASPISIARRRQQSKRPDPFEIHAGSLSPRRDPMH